MNEQKVNKIARLMGKALVEAGLKMISSAFHINPVNTSVGKLANKVKEIVPNVRGADYNYYLIDWETWKQIIEVDWVDKKRWWKERFDCDNFAHAFSSHCAELFGINSVGTVFGSVYENGTWKYNHYWNMMLTDKMEIYFYEPITDAFVKWEGGKVILHEKEYRPVSVMFL